MLRAHTSDRRQRRSYDRDTATHYLLVHVADQFGLEAFAIADEDGALQATSTDSPSGDALSTLLAQYSPALSCRVNTPRSALLEALETDLEHLGMGWTQDEVMVREFHVDGQRMLLTAVGEPGTMREVGVYRTIMGIRRIWHEAHDVQAA